MSDHELKHYGVLGMKWGVRRAARKATKDLRSHKRQAYREYSKAVDKYNNTWFNKKKSNERFAEVERTAQKSSDADKEYKDAYKKAKADAVNKLYPKQSKATNERVNSMSIGKAAVESMFMGSYGALKYNEARTEGTSRGRAAAKAILYNLGNNLTYGSIAAEQQVDNILARK